jgi:flagellar basal body-associated protein FliL
MHSAQNKGAPMNDEFNAKIKLLVKSEKALLSLEMKKKSRQTVWIALGLVAVLVTLVMINITAYLYLSSTRTPLEAAAIQTAVNIALAVLFFILASRQTLGAEAASIEDIRDFAWDQVSTDIDEVKQNVTEFKNSVVKVKKTVDGFTTGDAFGIKKVLPIITTLIDLNKRK